MSEAVFYTSVGLHERSVDLEYWHDPTRDAPWIPSGAAPRAEDGRRQFGTPRQRVPRVPKVALI